MDDNSLKTERLTLRAPRLEDADAIYLALQDKDVAQWLTGPPFPFTLEDAHTFIARDHGGQVFMIQDTLGVCGCISLTNGLGYWLAKDRWGRGYMTEAAHAVITHHFETSDEDLKSGYVLGNTASRAILERFGFHKDFVKPFYVPAMGKDVEIQKMKLSKRDWEASQ